MKLSDILEVIYAEDSYLSGVEVGLKLLNKHYPQLKYNTWEIAYDDIKSDYRILVTTILQDQKIHGNNPNKL